MKALIILLLVSACSAVNEKYIQVSDYVAQSPKYGAFAREPGPYDNAKAKAQRYIDGLKRYVDNRQPLIDAGRKAGYHDIGAFVSTEYVVDKANDTKTAFIHLANNCISSDYTVPDEFRFDTVGIRNLTNIPPRTVTVYDGEREITQIDYGNNKKVWKIACALQSVNVTAAVGIFHTIPLCNDVAMEDVFVYNGNKRVDSIIGGLYNKGYRQCKVITGKNEVYVIRFKVNKLGALNESSTKTLVDFIIKNSMWMKKLGITDTSGAFDFVSNMHAATKVYNDIMHEYTYWKGTETKIAIEAEERNTPFNPTLTGKIEKVLEDDFIALTSESSAGFLSLQMESALKTGNTMIGTFKVIKPLVQWNFEITATDGKVNGDSPDDFMKNADKPGKEGKVTDTYVMYSSVTSLAYRKKGTCNVKLTPAGKITIKGAAKDSPQFNNKEGVEMMPVTYREDLVPPGSSF